MSESLENLRIERSENRDRTIKTDRRTDRVLPVLLVLVLVIVIVIAQVLACFWELFA